MEKIERSYARAADLNDWRNKVLAAGPRFVQEFRGLKEWSFFPSLRMTWEAAIAVLSILRPSTGIVLAVQAIFSILSA